MKLVRETIRVAAWLLLGGGASAVAQASLSFTLDRSTSPPTRYTIRVEEGTGRGVYHSEAPAGTARASDVPLVVDAPTLKKLFAAVPLVKSQRCETHNKHIAQTGAKTLRYEPSGEAGGNRSECTYNYSDEDRVNTATTEFEGIGETMQYGDRLAAKLRFDRLGLDGEMDGLESALSEGRALDAGNIAPVLQAIQNDERVMDRVRRKAAHVLEAAGVPAVQGAGGAAATSER